MRLRPLDDPDAGVDVPGPATALAVANERFASVTGPLVASDTDGGVLFARRDAAGRYVSLEPRPGTAEMLDLLPHPEGGWFRQTWVAPVSVQPPGYPGARSTATAIHFLLGPADESRWHVVRSDELWLWQRGGSLTLLLGGNGSQPGEAAAITLGPDLDAGQTLQALVPGGNWQAARPASSAEVLVSCIVSPGFDFDDFHCP